jgi:hypothetical protein
MIRFFRTLGIVSLAVSAGRAGAAPRLALGENEKLVYHVSWAVLPAVGEIEVSAQAATDPNGTRLLRIVSSTRTRGLAYLLLPFKARSESLFDMSSGRLIWLGESSEKHGKNTVHSVRFDYAKNTADYIAPNAVPETRFLPMPRGYPTPTDLITCLLQARTWHMRPGDIHEALVLFEDDFYQLTIHAVGTESVTTPLGTYDTVILEPRMEKTPPKGMFRRGSTVRVWISTDESRLPLRFQVDFKFGAGEANLVEYQPPTAAER